MATSGAQCETLEDLDDRFEWASQILFFDADGFLFSRQQIFDDGRERNLAFSEGVLTEVVWSDPTDQKLWTTRTTTFDAATGYRLQFANLLDDGRTSTTQFTDNIRTSRVVEDTGNSFTFSSITTQYDALGRISSKLKLFDDGREVHTTYTQGIRHQSTIIDSSDAYAWQQRVVTYDAGGRVTSTTITFDDGTIETRTPDNPVNQTRIRHDDEDRFTWDQITTQYDALGQIAQEVRINDDGVTRITDYVDGVRAMATLTDALDSQIWSLQTFSYDSNGRPSHSVRTMDDGRVIETAFDQGLIATRTSLDSGDAYRWARQDRTYDAAGQLSSNEIDYDNGEVATVTYADGVLHSRVRVDMADVMDWYTIETVYSDAGALLYNQRTNDDGSVRFIDVRGRDIIADGISGEVTEDAAPALETSGQIETVAGYRGSSSFVAQTDVTGSAGLGEFTLNADGGWSYSAANNQATIQALNAGESLTDSFTAVTTDGVETEVTVTINGADDSAAPLYVGGDIVTVGTVGDLAGPQAPFDLATLFSDDMADDLTITVQGLPAYMSVVDGILTVAEPINTPANGVDYGETDVTITATDTDGNSTTQVVTLSVGVANDFDGIDLVGTFTASQSDDVVEASDSGANDFGTLRFLAGDDRLRLDNFFAESGGNYDVLGGLGNDDLRFGESAARSSGRIDVFGEDGADTILFGRFAGEDGGRIDVMGGAEADTISFGSFAASMGGTVRADGGDGNDTISVGNFAGENSGTVELWGGIGADQISVGTAAGISGGTIDIDLGVDSDPDQVRFQGSLNNVTIRNFTQGVDVLTFAGASAAAIWSRFDDGGDAFFDSDDRQSFIVSGAAGIDETLIAPGLIFNEAPTFVGASTNLPNATVGNAAPASYSVDLTTLFDDANIPQGDALTITVDGLPAGFAFSGSTLSIFDTSQFLAAGVHTISVTATDTSLFSVTQDVTVEVGLDQDFTGSDFAMATETVTGSDAADRVGFTSDTGPLEALTLDLMGGNDSVGIGDGFLNFGHDTTINLGDGTNEIIVGNDAFGGQGIMSFPLDDFFINGLNVITGGSGQDTFTFGDRIAQDGSNLRVFGLGGDDVFTTGADAGSTIAFSQVLLDGGTGADSFAIGARPGNVVVTLGADTDADTVTFEREVTGVIINNWVEGIDTVQFTGQSPDFWISAVDGDDLVLSDGFTQTVRITDAAMADPQSFANGIRISTPPEFVGTTTMLPNAQIGSEMNAPFEVDISALFDDVDIPRGDTLTFTATSGFSLPPGFEFDGTHLRITDPSSPDAVGEHTITVSAMDSPGQKTSVDLTVSVAIDHVFAAFDPPFGTTYLGSERDDRIEAMSVGGGSSAGGATDLDLLGGNDTLILGDRVFTLFTSVLLDLGDGENVLRVGDGAFRQTSSSPTVIGGADNDSFTFGDDLATGGTILVVSGFDGNDSFTVGDNAGEAPGFVSLNGGTGADQFVIGDNGTNIVVDFGIDTDVDSLTFEGRLTGGIIRNWTQGTDTITFTGQPGTTIWAATDSGADKQFTALDGQSFLVTGAAGVAATDIVTGLTYNSAPTYVGVSELPGSITDTYQIGSAGANGQAASLDLATLFDDADTGLGDSLTYSATGADFPLRGLSVANGMLTLDAAAAADVSNANFQFVDVTATDALGASVTQRVAIETALNHEVDFLFETDDNFLLVGSGFDDVYIASVIAPNPVFGSATGEILLGRGDDILDIGGGGFSSLIYSLEIDTGLGSDSITLGNSVGQGTSEFDIRTDAAGFEAGNDTISIGSNFLDPGGLAEINTGGGSDTLTFGTSAAISSTLDVVFGAGDETDVNRATFGANAGINGTISVTGSLGVDVISFDGRVENATLRLAPAATTDTAADQINFAGGPVSNVAIQEFDLGTDTITFTNPTGQWNAAEVGGTIFFTSDDGQSFRVEGVAGQDARLIAPDLTINLAPTYIGGDDALADAAAGSSASAFSYDIAALFTDADIPTGDSITVALTEVPTGFSYANGILSPVDVTDPALAGTYTIEATATDQGGASVTQSLSFDVALTHDFGDGFAGGDSETVTGTDLDDTIDFGVSAASSSGNLDVVGLGGSDTIRFGIGAGVQGQLVLDLRQGSEGDNVSFGHFSGTNGRVFVDFSEGNDTASFADDAGVDSTDFALNMGDGDNQAIFGDRAGQGSSGWEVFSGSGNDTVTLGDDAGSEDGIVLVSTGAGRDIVTIGDDAASDPRSSSEPGKVTVRLGADDDTLTFGTDAGASNSFGSGSVTVNAGTGADQITFGTGAANLDLQLAATNATGDGDADQVTFQGTVENATLRGFEVGTDTVDVLDPTAWAITNDTGSNTTLSDGTSDITFVGITGLTDPDDFLI